MKISLSLAVLALFGTSAAASAQGEADDLARKRAAKLAEPWVKQGDWITDYEQALAQSAQTHKPIFAYFTRSFAP